jgi:AcrR family transcriptional regulator
MNGASSRTYRQSARAEAAAATGERILDVTTDLFWERPTDQISLAEVARRSGVTVQTVLRRFGSKDDLLGAAAERQFARTTEERRPPADDPVGAVDVLLGHYEANGPGVLRLLAAEQSSPALARYADLGRRLHVEWCEHAFPSALLSLTGAARARRLAQVVAVCDVYTWKLLRQDAGLSRPQTRLALLELLEPLVTAPIGHP